MSGGDLVLVAAAGSVGALARHELMIRAHTPLRGVHVANLLGALLLGYVAVAAPTPWVLILGGGLLGSLTTFSTWVALSDADSRTGWSLTIPAVLGVLLGVAGAVLAGAGVAEVLR